MDFLEGQWKEPDEGIWEVRGPRRHFVHSKVMAWVAMDRAVKTVEKFDRDGPVERWRAVRDEIHARGAGEGLQQRHQQLHPVLRHRPGGRRAAADPAGRVPAGDRSADARHGRRRSNANCSSTVSSCATSRMSRRTSTACRRARARSSPARSGWPTTTGCRGAATKARKVLDRLLALRNDVGLLSEEYDVDDRPAGRQLPAGVLAPRAGQHRGVVPDQPRPAQQVEAEDGRLGAADGRLGRRTATELADGPRERADRAAAPTRRPPYRGESWHGYAAKSPIRDVERGLDRVAVRLVDRPIRRRCAARLDAAADRRLLSGRLHRRRETTCGTSSASSPTAWGSTATASTSSSATPTARWSCRYRAPQEPTGAAGDYRAGTVAV